MTEKFLYRDTIVLTPKYLNYLIRESVFFHFILEEHFELAGELVVIGVGRVVNFAVGENPVHVSFEQMLRHVVSKML